MADLLINGVDAKKIGVRMGKGFINELLTPFPLKGAITNESRLENGRRVLVPKPEKEGQEEEGINLAERFLDFREVNLTFIVEGVNSITFLRNLQEFQNILYEGYVEIGIPYLARLHKLTYQKSSNFSRTYDNTFCKVMVRFTEDLIHEQRAIKGSYGKSYNKSYG